MEQQPGKEEIRAWYPEVSVAEGWQSWLLGSEQQRKREVLGWGIHVQIFFTVSQAQAGDLRPN